MAEVRKVRLSHTALLSSHCLGNSNKYNSCPKHFASLSILHAELQEMTAVFSVVSYECPACFCSTVEQYIFSHVHRDHQNGMVV